MNTIQKILICSSFGKQEIQQSVPSLILESAASSAIIRNKSIMFTYLSEFWSLHHKKVALTLLSIPILTAVIICVEGMTTILRYRFFFGKAPIPVSPVFGVVVAAGEEDNTNSNDEEPIINLAESSQERYTQLFNVSFPHAFKMYRTKTQRDNDTLAAALTDEKPPIRILVMGDSIARGVGVTKSCTPIIPETVAKVVSTKMGGRPVFWTSLAENGASTSWIARQVEKQLRNIALQDYTKKNYNLLHDIDNDSMDEKEKWIHLLEYHKHIHNSTPLGNYDVVILFNGINDLKRLILPFMSFGEEEKEHSPLYVYNGLSSADRFRLLLERIINGLGHTNILGDSSSSSIPLEAPMKEISISNRTTSKNLLEQLLFYSTLYYYNGGNFVEPHTTTLFKIKNDNDSKVDINLLDESCLDGLSIPISICNLNDDEKCIMESKLNRLFPKPRRRIVLMPIPHLKEVMKNIASVIMQRFAVILFGKMNKEKFKIANQYPQSVFCANLPDNHHHHGIQNELCRAIRNDNVLLSLISISANECHDVETQMKTFNSNLPMRFRKIQEDDIFAADGIHPSDLGYDRFGRFCGLEVVKRLKVGSNYCSQRTNGRTG